MQLPEKDESFLRERGFAWEFQPSGDHGILVIKGLVLASERFDRESTDLMIRVPQGYPVAALDMYYVDPPLRLRTTNAHPIAADHFETHGGRRWQRFSRHLPQSWRPGVDNLRTYFAVILPELRN